ncbi:hypothetical protein IFE17_02755 [Actinobacillus sp. GY-402]|nr:hypothetical protein IFE17_02755 [Actinobacillus sp. GY-402]
MKKLLITILACAMTLPAFAMTEEAQKEVAKALTGDYQTLRNVAYAMKDGTFGHDKNPISACALRRVILFVNADKVDATDYSNEAIDCREIAANENQQAWETAITVIKSINATK